MEKVLHRPVGRAGHRHHGGRPPPGSSRASARPAPGAVAEKPEVRGAIIVMLAIPETLVILGFVVAVLILTGK